MISIAFSMVWLDIAVFHTDILEMSFTEITQELMLFACAILFWYSRPDGQPSGFNYLTAGFFGCLLMRELDGLFDPISHSAWCWPFMVVAVWAVGNALKPNARAQTLARLEAFVATPAFATISTGFAVLLFSRIFGMGSFWHLVLGPGYERLAKTTVEEGIELLSYGIWLAASIEYYVYARLAVVPAAQSGSRVGTLRSVPRSSPSVEPDQSGASPPGESGATKRRPPLKSSQ
jgi:hypothetical protein